MRIRRPLLVLAKCFSLYGTFYVISAIVILCIAVAVPAVFGVDRLVDLPKDASGQDGLWAIFLDALLKPEHRAMTAALVAIQLGSLVMLAGVWEKIAQLVRIVADGRWHDERTGFVLKRLAIFLIVSFIFDVMTRVAFGAVQDWMASGFVAFRQHYPHMIPAIAEAAVGILIHESASDILLPGLHGSIKLVLALLCVFALQVVRRVERTDGELAELRAEQSLTV